MSETPRWASESFWKKVAVWVTAGSFLILVILTFDTLKQTAAGGERVPAYSVINMMKTCISLCPSLTARNYYLVRNLAKKKQSN